MSRIDDVLAHEGAAAEDYEMPEQLPGRVHSSRPNMAKPTVVSVRLSSDEHHAIQRAAKKAGLPVSTFIRLRALEYLRGEESDTGISFEERLRRLEQEVFRHSA